MNLRRKLAREREDPALQNGAGRSCCAESPIPGNDAARGLRAFKPNNVVKLLTLVDSRQAQAAHVAMDMDHHSIHVFICCGMEVHTNIATHLFQCMSMLVLACLCSKLEELST